MDINLSISIYDKINQPLKNRAYLLNKLQYKLLLNVKSL